MRHESIEGDILILYTICYYRDADKSSDRPGRKLMFLSEWREFPSAPCLAGKQKNLDDSSRLDVVEIERVEIRDCFLPGRAKDLTAPR